MVLTPYLPLFVFGHSQVHISGTVRPWAGLTHVLRDHVERVNACVVVEEVKEGEEKEKIRTRRVGCQTELSLRHLI